MPSSMRISSCVKAPRPSKHENMLGFNPYPLRKMTTRQRTVNYREPDSDSDDDVIYVGQRNVQRDHRSVPTPALPDIILGDEDCVVNPIIKPFKEQTTVEVLDKKSVVGKEIVIVEHNDRGRLQTLPYEIHQNIAAFFENDSDVNIYAQLCKQTRDSISSSVWRKRFSETFDMPEGDFETLALAKKYAYRRDVAGWICFDLKRYGAVSRECKTLQDRETKKCLNILRELILESNARKIIDTRGNQLIIGLNHDYIRHWAKPEGHKYTDILDAVLNTEKTSWDHDDVVSARTDGSLVLVIQLCLTSLSLHPDTCNKVVSHFDMSQREAYTDHVKQAVFVGIWKQDVNVRWLLHAVNFFKFHLKAQGEGTLAQHYEELERDQLPQPWLGRIKEGTQQIGSHWKSAHTFMKDYKTLMALRRDGNEDEPMVDDGEMFSDLTIFFDDSKLSSNNWPKSFEALIESNPYTTSSSPGVRQTRTGNPTANKQYEFKTFYGTSRGLRAAHFYGRIHGVPQQQGIPGFQRIAMIKFFPLNGEYDPSQVWAYEGCVLPGGRIMIGKWWDLSADPRDAANIYGGPFIWWNVDKSAAEPRIAPQEALEFLDSIHDPNLGFS